MSYPFFIWTVQRTGGTSLAELLMAMSEHKRAEHEPFNWRRKPRQFAAVARNWAETKDLPTLQSALKAIFDEKHLIKHCYELHGTPLNVRILQIAAKTDYRHILLLRRDELSRLASKYIAEANGTWFKDYAAQVYAGIAAGVRQLQPLPIDEIVATYKHVSNTTERIRQVLAQLDVERREVWYEDIYTGDRETRMAHLEALFGFLGFSPETIAAHQADIEEKIFAGGQNTGNILQFVPNLAAVRRALADAGREKHRDDGFEQPPRDAPVATHDDRPKDDIAADPFFTTQKGFTEENGLGYNPKELHRLNARYRTFFAPQIANIKGKRVLDLGSYDGRWSFAALASGAAHVTAVEQRRDFVERSRFFIPDDMRDRLRFMQDDIFDALPQLLAAGERFDVVLCLGLLYEVIDHHRLLSLMTAAGPELIVVDSNLVDDDEPIIRLKTSTGPKGPSVAGTASRGGIELLARQLGYRLRYEKWRLDAFANLEGLQDYFSTNKAGVRRYSFYMNKV